MTILNKWKFIFYLLSWLYKKLLVKTIKHTTLPTTIYFYLPSGSKISKGNFLHPFWLSELTCPAACQVKFMEWMLTGMAGILCCAFLKSCVKGAIFPSETIRISSSNPVFKNNRYNYQARWSVNNPNQKYHAKRKTVSTGHFFPQSTCLGTNSTVEITFPPDVLRKMLTGTCFQGKARHGLTDPKMLNTPKT